MLRQGLVPVQGQHRPAAQTDAGTDTVVAGVTGTHDNHILPLYQGAGTVGQLGVQQALGHRRQEVHRKQDPLGIPVRHIQVPGLGGTAAQHHRVILIQQLLGSHSAAHVGVGAEVDPLRCHQVHPALNHLFVQLHVGDAVHQQAADPVGPLIDSDCVAPVVQLVRHRQPGRAGADDGHLFPSPQLGRRRLHQAVVVGVFDQGQLVLPDGNRIPVGTADAGRLAEPGQTRPVNSGKLLVLRRRLTACSQLPR